MKVSGEKVTMSKHEFVHEHKRLVHILESRQHEGIEEEAADQAAELKEVRNS